MPYQLPSVVWISASVAPASWGCSSWRATWKATCCSCSPPRADSTVQPRRRRSAHLGEQAGLAEPRGPGEGEQAAAPPGAVVLAAVGAPPGELAQRLLGGDELGLAFQQRAPGLCTCGMRAPPGGRAGARAGRARRCGHRADPVRPRGLTAYAVGCGV